MPVKKGTSKPAASLASGMNKDQQTFCCLPTGAVRLIAPAGCGKTYSLLYRCLHLAKNGSIENPKFLLFTFTRAAREELCDRVKSDPAFAPIAPLVTITTLNVWGFRKLKNMKHNLQLKTSKTDRFFALNNVLQPVWEKHDRVADTLKETRSKHRASDVIMNLLDMLKSLGFRHDRIKTKEDVLAHIQFLHECGMEPQLVQIISQLTELDIIRGTNEPLVQLYNHFVKFWIKATDHLFQSSIISLEDQKYWSWIDLEDQVAKKKFWSGAAQYHYVLVDEFQDINPLDLALLKSIAAINKAQLTIVGDDDQAIYEWRGASPDFILNPDKHIAPGYETVILGTNYRSPKNIVDLSQKLIAHNKRRVPKKVVASSTTDARVDVLGVPSLGETIELVLKLVKQLLDCKEIDKVAIIGRKRSQIIPYQIVFAGNDIPFYAAEDLQVFLTKAFEELKGILAIRAKANKSGLFGSNPVNDILTLCDKVKRFPLAKKDREGLKSHLAKANPRTLRAGIDALRNYSGSLKGDNDGGKMSNNFADAIEEVLDAKTVAEIISAISDNFEGLKKDYGKSIDDIFYADPPFLHLAEYAQRYGDDLQKFYEDMEKAIATLARIPPEDEDDGEQAWKLPLHLMTALRAKGKEFDAVIILDANEGIWPSKLAEGEFQLEAERRVFYVAMTRAKKHLVFLVNDFILDESVAPTRYLSEMGLTVKKK